MATIHEQLEQEFSSLYPEDRQNFETVFFADPKIKQMKQKASQEASQFRVMQSLEIENKIKKIELQALQKYKSQMTWKKETIDLLKLGLPRDVLETIIHDIVGIHMVCDVLESLTNEIEYLLEQNAPDWKFETFDNILQVGKKATEQIKWIYRNTDLMKYESWGNECDKFTKMFRDKAAKLMRKAAESRVRNKSKEVTEEGEQE